MKYSVLVDLKVGGKSSSVAVTKKKGRCNLLFVLV